MSTVNATSRSLPDAAPGSFAGLIPSWTLSLHAGRKSPKTVRTYLDAAEQLLAFLETAGMPTDLGSIRREHVEAFIVHLIDTRSASTAATRFRALQQLFKWLEDEGEITASPMARMRPPKLDEPLVPHLGEAEIGRTPDRSHRQELALRKAIAHALEQQLGPRNTERGLGAGIEL